VTDLATRAKRFNADHFPRRLLYAPEWLVLGVNNICNMHCKMCDVGLNNADTNFYANLMGADPVNMPLELFERIVDQAATHWPRVKLGFAFTEPLIYPHLFEAATLARAHGLASSVTTNGLQLDKKAAALAEAGVGDVFVSLDGPPEVHNHIRGHARGFERAYEGIRALTALPGGPGVSVFCVITEWNAGRLLEFADLFRGLPLRAMGFMHALFTPQSVADAHNARHGARYHATASNLGEHDASHIDFDALAKEIAALREARLPFPVSFSPDLRTPDELRRFYLEPAVLMGRRCSDAARTIMIKSDGSTVPAHGRCYNLPLGNVYRQSLPEIWNGAPLAQFRADLNAAGGLLPACARCCSAYGK
jgi:MoaA/NifB/PqqE/SkfB family radical SAM enzyme